MLKNKLYLYGDGKNVKLSGHMNVAKELLQRFQEYDRHDAVIKANTDQRMTFKEMAQLIVDIALSLTRIGVRKGDIVSICSDNEIVYIPTVLGIIAAGAIYSPVQIDGGRAYILHRMNLAPPKIIFCSPEAYEKKREIWKEVESIEKIIIYGEAFEETLGFKGFLTEHADLDEFEPVPVNAWEDVACIMFSSGTTGMPKGIEQTHLSILLSWSEVYEERYVGHTSLITRDWYNTSGLQRSLHTLFLGATVVFTRDLREENLYEVITKYSIESLRMEPPSLASLLKSDLMRKYDLSSIVFVTCSASPCDKKLLEAAKERFPRAHVSQYYAMSEIFSISSDRGAPCGTRLGSVGTVHPLCILKIVDLTTRKPLGPNQRGEICVKSPLMMKGYIGESIKYLDDEGFFLTGDVGYYDEDKYLYIVDRIKDMIKFNGYQVAPAELEAILSQHPSVREAGVVGAPQGVGGELPTAFVVLQPGADGGEKELVDYVHAQVPKIIRLAGGIRFVDKLPHGAGYKLDRKALRLLLDQQ